MKYIGLLLGCLCSFLIAEEAPTVANKAEFVYPDFTQCYEKNKQSIVYFGSVRAVAISDKLAVAYSKEKPNVPFLRSDYLSHLYLFESSKPLAPVKLKATEELKIGEWLESLTENSLIVVNASKIGTPNELFEFAGQGKVNSIVGGLCCEMYGLGIGEQYFIGSEVLKRFIDGKSAAYPEIGARLIESDDGLVVDAIDPSKKEVHLQVGDKITMINTTNVKTLLDVDTALKAVKAGSKLMAKVQRGQTVSDINLLAEKPAPKKSVPVKTPLPQAQKIGYLQTRGMLFDDHLKMIHIDRGSFAEQSGLKLGDRLMQVDSFPIQKPEDVDTYLSRNPGYEHHLLFDRNDFQFFVTLKR